MTRSTPWAVICVCGLLTALVGWKLRVARSGGTPLEPVVVKAVDTPLTPEPDRLTRHAPLAAVSTSLKPALTDLVDVNSADEPQLRTLPGIGPTLAAGIMAERAKKPFTSADDLRRVRGIGVKTLDRIRPFVAIGP